MAAKLSVVRCALLLIAAGLVACSSGTAPEARKQADPTSEKWYGETLSELSAINRQALDSFHSGKADEASALILKGEPLSKRLISVPKPSLAAAEAASDLDRLYGQMLYSNKNYGWARLLFQKNLARWKYWTPQTPETLGRLKEAQSEIAQCDRVIVQ